MQFYCSEQMQNRELNTCKQDIYSFLHFLLPTNTEPLRIGLPKRVNQSYFLTIMMSSIANRLLFVEITATLSPGCNVISIE